jgi:hypothetical protein
MHFPGNDKRWEWGLPMSRTEKVLAFIRAAATSAAILAFLATIAVVVLILAS